MASYVFLNPHICILKEGKCLKDLELSLLRGTKIRKTLLWLIKILFYFTDSSINKRKSLTNTSKAILPIYIPNTNTNTKNFKYIVPETELWDTGSEIN